MSIFSSTFGQLARSIAREAGADQKTGKAEYHEKLAASAQERYSAAFSTPRTVAEAAEVMGISEKVCYPQVYRYQKRALIEKVDSVPRGPSGKPTTRWRWKS